MNVAIIPARGGSKGIPGKNLKPVNGLPLIAWTIRQALAADCIDDVFVSTDCRHIAKTARAYGAQVITRPDHLATDTATSESCLDHAIHHIEQHYSKISTVIFLQCTSPVRRHHDIDSAYRTYIDTNADSLLSVVQSHAFNWTLNSDGFASPVNYDYLQRPRRQEMTNMFRENGSIYIFSPETFRLNHNRLGGSIALYEMSEASGYEIDTQTDLQIVEMLLIAESQCVY